MKKLATVFCLAATLFWPGTGLALQFSPPVLLGGFAGRVAEYPYNARSTSLEGRYYDFGRDKNHVIRYYNYGSGYGDREWIGPADNPEVRYPGSFHELYEIQSDIGIRFYIATGQGSDGWCWVDIFGRDKSGKFVRYLNSRDLKKYRSDGYHDPLGSPTVFVRGDTIVLDCGSRSRSGRDERWQYILKWDDKAQWFGIDYQVL